ncbi:isoaspartyl peptidase/L-asparaginase [Parapedobacter sp. ISTM3]|uniref:isoaspartyl peptidase/L-asparaginase family protein n=1 Tax=Parapedobacter sp. ISTM3 TaxID=2800130 RepID=UPI0019045DFD|nr:isoaspartyl peptidase/L-asparaginase [Parapedobacter sp. ISTM3]MBK1440295.1 isoaspartyl peptidase/L-asparaginase [Parapedobacter sp. ISTM3]
MNYLYTLILVLAMNSMAFGQARYVMVIHGGAGTILKENMTPDQERAFREALTQALQAGYSQLQAGKSSLDAVEAAILVMEDNPLFNAGKGAVFTHEGKNELDAAVMWGPTQAAGAIAGVTTIRNPIKAARAVMEQSEHVMLTGRGAEVFAASKGLEIVEPSYFWTKSRWKALERVLRRDSLKTQLDHDGNNQSSNIALTNDYKYGTVGAVALDKAGRLAAGTSTGGMTNKQYGRIGDAPIIGAGTYANQRVAISCTGWGEFFIRGIAAYDVAAQMEYGNTPVVQAASAVIEKIGKMGGDGGMIALDSAGNMAMPFNTAGMYRGAVTESGEIEIAIYK